MMVDKFCCYVQRLTLVTLLLTLLALPAEAKPQDWTDDSYNFKGVQKVYIHDMDLTVAEKAGLSDINAKNLLKNFKQRGAEKMKNAEIASSPETAQVYVQARIVEYQINSWTIPEHYVTKFTTRERTYKDNKGKEYKETFKEPYQEFVPAETRSNSQVRLRIDVYDAKTNDVVFSRDDTRVDEYEVDLARTYDKLVTAFWTELNKKVKNK